LPGSGSAAPSDDFVDTGDGTSGINGGYGTYGANAGTANQPGGYLQNGWPSVGGDPASGRVRFAPHPGENLIYLYGPEGEVSRCTQYLRKFDSPRKHVLIEALVLEVDTEAFESLRAKLTNLSSKRWSNVIADFGSLLGKNLAFSNSAGVDNPTTFSAVVEFLIGQNVARVITRPYVSTLSGKAATVNITSDQYLLVQQSDAGATVTTPSSVSAGVILKIFPSVIGNHSVRLRLDVEESTFGIPSEKVAVQIDRNNATTVAQIPFGRSVIIGGLMLNRSLREDVGFPFLRHLPILNLFFSEQGSARRTQEVVAIVTPYIWTPDLKTPLAEPKSLRLESAPSILSDFERMGDLPDSPGIIHSTD